MAAYVVGTPVRYRRDAFNILPGFVTSSDDPFIHIVVYQAGGWVDLDRLLIADGEGGRDTTGTIDGTWSDVTSATPIPPPAAKGTKP